MFANENKFDLFIGLASAQYQVPVPWIKAVIAKESSFNPNALRLEVAARDQSVGLMQILTRTARNLGFRGSVQDLYDPAVNIDIGTKLLGLLRSQHQTFERVYSAYNSGKPTAYLTNPQVRLNVENAKKYLDYFSVVKKNSSERKPTAL